MCVVFDIMHLLYKFVVQNSNYILSEFSLAQKADGSQSSIKGY